MAKKRTGLQSEIAGIFSGVPVPKKGGTRSKTDSSGPKPDSPVQKPVAPASKQSGSVIPKPVTPQPKVPVAPVPKKIEEPLPAAPKPKVVKVKAPEKYKKKISKKVSRKRKDKVFAPKSGVSSSRQKVGITLLFFFSAALVFVLLRPDSASRRNTTSRNTQQVNAGITTVANVEIDWPVPPVYSANLRDPMKLGSLQQIIIDTSEDLVVRGISYSEDRRYAVIGTDTVQEDDLVPGTKIKVKKINPNSVEFEEDGKIWTQKVEGEKR